MAVSDARYVKFFGKLVSNLQKRVAGAKSKKPLM